MQRHCMTIIGQAHGGIMGFFQVHERLLKYGNLFHIYINMLNLFAEVRVVVAWRVV